MRYHMRERAWSLTEAFVVRNDAGQPIFEVRGKFFHIGDNLVMYDCYTGQELVQIKQHVLSLLPHYEMYRNGQHWASMHEQLRLFGEAFKVEGSNGMVFHVNGDIWKSATPRPRAGTYFPHVPKLTSPLYACRSR